MSGTSENTLPAPECASCKDGTGSSKCASCPSKSPEKQAQKTAQQQAIESRLKGVKHRIAIVSGKGGVGKSTITASLALNLSMMGFKVGVLDADVSGPNIPHLLGLEGRHLEGSALGLEPIMSRNGIKAISSEFVLTTSDTPMLWRGPMRTSLVTQFVTDVNWGELDYLLIDLPPGTGDEPMSVMQLIPLDGIIIVSTSSNLSILDVSKIINMAKTIERPGDRPGREHVLHVLPRLRQEDPVVRREQGREAGETLRAQPHRRSAPRPAEQRPGRAARRWPFADRHRGQRHR